MERLRVILDTKPIIKLFAQEEGWEKVREIFVKIEEGEIEGAISVVTLTEIYYIISICGREDVILLKPELML